MIDRYDRTECPHFLRESWRDMECAACGTSGIHAPECDHPRDRWGDIPDDVVHEVVATKVCGACRSMLRLCGCGRGWSQLHGGAPSWCQSCYRCVACCTEPDQPLTPALEDRAVTSFLSMNRYLYDRNSPHEAIDRTRYSIESEIRACGTVSDASRMLMKSHDLGGVGNREFLVVFTRGALHVESCHRKGTVPAARIAQAVLSREVLGYVCLSCGGVTVTGFPEFGCGMWKHWVVARKYGLDESREGLTTLDPDTCAEAGRADLRSVSSLEGFDHSERPTDLREGQFSLF